ncbi:hypothetical protein [Microbacterium sp. CH12i]|uniref:hypothetical protein n=1 Tax=Microbacterium sp. CH12i TaxID=1479651 RepID=UPI001268E9B9|nr:hypothetical protein [Microbacterium sp. CH12i]
MNLLSRLRVTPSIHVRLSVAGHSEFDRSIELPSGASADWLVEAYLLSLGTPRDDIHSDFDGRLELSPPHWRVERQTMRLPEIPHEIDVFVMGAGTPAVGDPCVAVVDAEPDAPAPVIGRWQSDAPPFRVHHINNELAQRFGVVVPRFDDSGLAGGHGIRSSSRLDSLLRSLAPTRRLALLVHLDDTGILEERPLEWSTVESALASLTALFECVGAAGLVQDSETGWLADRDVAAIVRALGWASAGATGAAAGGADSVSAPGEALLSLARQSKLIRRLKGRILVTKRGRSLVEPGSKTLCELARAVTERGNRYGGWSFDADSCDQTLALLAIADGSAETFAELPALVDLGRAATEEYRCSPDGYDEYGLYTSPFDRSASNAETGMPVQVRQTIDRLAALSEPDRFGVISPAMRAVARAALL